MIKIKDGRTELYQWDTGSVLTVGEGIDEVHFARSPVGRSITVSVANGEAKVEDVLLQTAGKLFVWGFVGSAEDGYTKLEREFTVRARNKPADYVFTPPEQTTLAAIMAELAKVQAVVTPEAIGKQVQEYLSENPVEGSVEVDDTLTQAGQAADAKAVGDALEKKLDADKLPEAVNDALAQAKESGEFDGDDYVLTEADKEEIAEMAAELVEIPEGGGTGGNGKEWKYDKYITITEDTEGLTLDAYDDGTPFDFTEVEVYAALKNSTEKIVWGCVFLNHDGLTLDNKRLPLGGNDSSISASTQAGTYYLLLIRGHIDSELGVYGETASKAASLYINNSTSLNVTLKTNIPNYAYNTTGNLKGWKQIPTKFVSVTSNMRIGANSTIWVRGR